jgi:dTDP-4-amino-4,6-dideoxygalactose transaminase
MELDYIRQAVERGHISGNGYFTSQCQRFFEERYGFKKCLLTSSCTDALEMAALLIDAGPDDEIILPSYTFVSTANAFALRGCKLVFADSQKSHPNMDADLLEELITPKTKAIVVVHYAGIACDMAKVTDLATKHNLLIIEDAAQAIDSYYNGKPLGSFGHLSAFSFHETKNIISGEGGMLVVNRAEFEKRAEILWEKGTNRSAFFRGEVDKYGWVDVGSSFLPSDIIAAFLYAQIQNLPAIQKKRIELWVTYYESLLSLSQKGYFSVPSLPGYATNNGHLFSLVLSSLEVRTRFLKFLGEAGVHAVFHYQSLHHSAYFRHLHDGRSLPNSDRYTDCLVRLPLYYELQPSQQSHVIKSIHKFFE